LHVERTGRSKSIRLTRIQRRTIFRIYEEYQNELNIKYHKYLDLEDYALTIIKYNSFINQNKKFDYVFIDEVQDLDPMQIYALTLLTKGSIVLSGDAKQRIYKKTPIRYEDIGLNLKEKGRRKILNKNYRSTEQIVKLANDLVFFDNNDKLIEKQFVKSGDKPIVYFGNERQVINYISKEIKSIHQNNPKKTIAIVHREDIKQKNEGKSKFRTALECQLLLSFADIKTYTDKFEFNKSKQIFYTNAYDIKGLEFDIVFVIDFNKDCYPDRNEIYKIRKENEGKDESLVNEDIADFMNREKKLLYVAMTRAREKLYIIANKCEKEQKISNFIFDFEENKYSAANFTKKKIKMLAEANDARLKTLLGEKYNRIYNKKESDRVI
ncbi:MAG: 3'-5' exonuclease, partial [Sarcina sp.]